ncbi:MAG: MlaD family protein [Ignavibacteria bacterium]|jgi:phospholipid/cholesterol/gamma-HCH transport system substrate-binding protein
MERVNLKFSNLKVGLTVLAGMSVLFFYVIFIGTELNLFTNTYKLKVFLQSAEGLQSGSMVSLGGMKVGHVTDVVFSQKDGENGVDVIFEIREEYKGRITETSVVTISTQGLLGDMFLNISQGQPHEIVMEDNNYIPVKELISLEEISEKATPIIDELTGTLKNLNKITAELADEEKGLGKLISDSKIIDDIQSTVNNLKSLSAALIDKNGTIGKLVYDNSLYDTLIVASTNLNTITNDIKEGTGSLGKLVTDESLYNNLNELSVNLNKMVEKTESDSTVVGGMLNDGEMYNNLMSTIKALDELLKDFKENPGRYINVSVF